MAYVLLTIRHPPGELTMMEREIGLNPVRLLPGVITAMESRFLEPHLLHLEQHTVNRQVRVGGHLLWKRNWNMEIQGPVCAAPLASILL